MLKDIKGFSKTVGGNGVGLSAVRVGVRGGGANRECCLEIKYLDIQKIISRYVLFL